MHEADDAYLIWPVPGRSIGSEWMITAFTKIELSVRRFANDVGPEVLISSVQQIRTLQKSHTTRTK